MVKIPLYFYTKSTLIKPYVMGYVQNPRDEHLFKWIWIDLDWAQHPDDNPPAFEPPAPPAPGAYGKEKK